ncbi:deoxyribose-phosphate aldolase, deoC [Pediococcus acidilactici D3]|nr:deoxyribose-phosphate aldolase, deoC [Pediococcus acidilactici D3]
MDLAKYIDHTILAPNATEEQVEKIISEALEYGFASVCINPYWVKKVAQGLSKKKSNSKKNYLTYASN